MSLAILSETISMNNSNLMSSSLDVRSGCEKTLENHRKTRDFIANSTCISSNYALAARSDCLPTGAEFEPSHILSISRIMTCEISSEASSMPDRDAMARIGLGENDFLPILPDTSSIWSECEMNSVHLIRDFRERSR